MIRKGRRENRKSCCVHEDIIQMIIWKKEKWRGATLAPYILPSNTISYPSRYGDCNYELFCLDNDYRRCFLMMRFIRFFRKRVEDMMNKMIWVCFRFWSLSIFVPFLHTRFLQLYLVSHSASRAPHLASSRPASQPDNQTNHHSTTNKSGE